jgi:hypothetical protein
VLAAVLIPEKAGPAIGMRSHSGVCKNLLALGECGHKHPDDKHIRNQISVVIDEARVDQGANLVHAGFGLGRTEP